MPWLGSRAASCRSAAELWGPARGAAAPGRITTARAYCLWCNRLVRRGGTAEREHDTAWPMQACEHGGGLQGCLAPGNLMARVWRGEAQGCGGRTGEREILAVEQVHVGPESCKDAGKLNGDVACAEDCNALRLLW